MLRATTPLDGESEHTSQRRVRSKNARQPRDTSRQRSLESQGTSRKMSSSTSEDKGGSTEAASRLSSSTRACVAASAAVRRSSSRSAAVAITR